MGLGKVGAMAGELIIFVGADMICEKLLDKMCEKTSELGKAKKEMNIAYKDMNRIIKDNQKSGTTLIDIIELEEYKKAKEFYEASKQAFNKLKEREAELEAELFKINGHI